MNNHLPAIGARIADADIPEIRMNLPVAKSIATQFCIAPIDVYGLYDKEEKEHKFSNHYQMFIFTQGEGIFEDGNSQNIIQRGSVFFINQGTSFNIVSENAQGYRISFSSDFLAATDVTAIPLLFKLLYHNYNESFMDIITDEALDEISFIAISMQKECFTMRNMSREILQGLFFLLMRYVMSSAKQLNNYAFCDRSLEYANHYINLVKVHYKTHKQVADYARMMCLTPGFLNNVIKRKTGRTASNHIYNTIVHEAKKKAAFSTASMKEIAYDLGFDDIYHFSKFFKKNSGLNFSYFRKGLMDMSCAEIV